MAYLQEKFVNPGVVETPADPFSLDALIAWLRTKPADEVYCWENAGQCLYSQYGTAIGLGSGLGAYQAATDGFRASGASRVLGFHLSSSEGAVANGYPRTFGAALQRALSLQSEAR